MLRGLGRKNVEERDDRPESHTHTHPNTNIFPHSHINTDILLSLAGWTKLPTCPPSFMLKRHLCALSSIIIAKEKKKVIPVSVGVVLADHGIPPAEEAERDKQDRGRAHYSSEDRRWRLFAYAGNNTWITHTHWKLNYILCYTSDASVMKQKH